MLGMGGMGMGSPLLTGLMGGGLGYLFGSSRGNQQQEPVAAQPVGPPAPPAPAPAQPEGATRQDDLAQLKLLGELHESGVLDDDEFAREKRRILDR